MVASSGVYLEEMYDKWNSDKSAVPEEWARFFADELPNAIEHSRAKKTSAASTTVSQPRMSSNGATEVSVASMNESLDNPSCHASILDHMKVQLLVRAYQVRGHHRADLDPLGILKPDLDFCPAPELDLSYYGLTDQALDEEFILGQGVLPNVAKREGGKMTLSQILEVLKATYCSTIGIEYTHIPDRDRCDWIRSKMEVPVKYQYTKAEKLVILDRLIWADSFEKFLHSKFPGEKRFGLEGCEALIPGMKALVDRSVDHGVESVVIGMPHRGRLNVLSNVVRKPAESIFSEFHGQVDEGVEGSGDVKYHLGMNYERPTPSGKIVHLSLVANPSHLEAVNPVVQGKTRALQFYLNDKQYDKAMGLLIHGDAAFAGQGVVYEALGFGDLPHYSTGGTVHIVVNNQIGFTTDPRFARSTPYCTALAKSMSAPILHVNADDVEAVIFCCQFAADWRKTYKKDVVIDLIGYRRHGHNEFDEPSFTQPRMYDAIRKKERVLDIYRRQLVVDEKIVSQEQVEGMMKSVWDSLEKAYNNSKNYKPTVKEWLTSTWPGFKSPKDIASSVAPIYPTGVTEDTLRTVGTALCTVPTEFNLHKGLAKILEVKKKAIDSSTNIDMPTAEALAFGSLLLEGNHVRLSGQDVERGTFSHRHAVLHDQVVDGSRYVPLHHLDPSQAQFTVCNSSLSEYGVLGFELGYSLVNPRSLILWEAQFGDFCNGAQIIIDQFLVSGERKWLQRSGVTMLLPHGFDGQGPEHSSGRPERFLQLCDDDPNVLPVMSPPGAVRQIQDCNIQVCMVSTPANYFHVLRRQVHRDFRKPLVLFNSKALLRHPLARSSFEEMKEGTTFTRMYPEMHPKDIHEPAHIDTVVFCSGQVYYQALKTRELNGVKNVALLRLEQISPFPYDLIMQQLFDVYKNAKRIVWLQEEPLNMGMWTYVEPRFKNALRAGKREKVDREVSVVARPPSCAVATGIKKLHHQEELSLMSRAMFGGELLAVKSETNGVPIFKKKD